jgi:hypothetical protein
MEEKEQEAKTRRDAGKAGGPPAPPAGQVPQPSKEAQGKGSGVQGAWSATRNQGASSAEGSWAATFEEAEIRLVRSCAAEALDIQNKLAESKSHLDKVGVEATREDAPQEETQRLVKEWQKTNSAHWKLKEAERRMDLRHPDQAADERLARKIALARKQVEDDKASDEEADRELAHLRRQTEEEADVQRARLAAKAQKLRQKSSEADRREAEAKVAASNAAYQLSRVLEEEQEVEDTMQNLYADIASDEASGRAKDAAARRRSLAEALEQTEKDKAAAKKEQAPAPMAGHSGLQPGAPSATE